MEKKASNRFILMAVLWVILGEICCIPVLVVIFEGISMIFPIGLPFIEFILECIFFIIPCAVLAFIFLGAGYYAIKSVKNRFPDLKDTDLLKFNVTLFYEFYFVSEIIIFLIIIDELFTFIEWILGENTVAKVLSIITVFITAFVPLLMIPYCRSKIDKLYPKDITEEEIQDGKES